MKYFLDIEFIENGKTMDLISIGIVDSNENSIYLINGNCDFSKADDWVLDNVLKPIGLSKEGFRYKANDTNQPKEYRDSYLSAVPYSEISTLVENFVNKDNPEFWGDCCSYDWVVFCQLFGTMMDLPKGFPMYCNDIQQLWRSKGCPELPKQSNRVHNALEDARYVKELYGVLTTFNQSSLKLKEYLGAKNENSL